MLNTTKLILQDIEEVSASSEDAAKKILLNICSTMSDRASTQIKLNELLEEYRKDILPLTVSNYDVLSDAEKLSLARLCIFFLWPPRFGSFSGGCIICNIRGPTGVFRRSTNPGQIIQEGIRTWDNQAP